MNRDRMLAYIEEQAALARTYLEDGAPTSCARVLRDLAGAAEVYATAINQIMQEMIAGAGKEPEDAKH